MSEAPIPPPLQIDTNLLVLILDAIEDIDAQMVGGDPIMMEDVAEEAGVDVEMVRTVVEELIRDKSLKPKWTRIEDGFLREDDKWAKWRKRHGHIRK